jgi:heat shock protein HslJ
MMKRIIFLLVITGSFIGCKTENLIDPELLNTKWILSYIQNTKTYMITNYPGDATKRISIQFSGSPDIVSFNGVCNNGSGTYTYSSNPGEIKITGLATTLIGCKYVEWETYTVQNLNHASKYQIANGKLTIYSNGAYNLFFTKN